MRRFAIALGLLVGLASGPAVAQEAKDQLRADAAERHLQSCPFSAVSASACPSLRMGPRADVRFDRAARQREARDLYASIKGSLDRGDCEGARAKAVDDGRHELAARIRRACKRAA